MAKIMISIPDDLLAELDRSARVRGATRSGVLQALAAEYLRQERDAQSHRIARLLDAPGRYDGSGAEHVRTDRER